MEKRANGRQGNFKDSHTWIKIAKSEYKCAKCGIILSKKGKGNEYQTNQGVAYVSPVCK